MLKKPSTPPPMESTTETRYSWQQEQPLQPRTVTEQEQQYGAHPYDGHHHHLLPTTMMDRRLVAVSVEVGGGTTATTTGHDYQSSSPLSSVTKRTTVSSFGIPPLAVETRGYTDDEMIEEMHCLLHGIPGTRKRHGIMGLVIVIFLSMMMATSISVWVMATVHARHHAHADKHPGASVFKNGMTSLGSRGRAPEAAAAAPLAKNGRPIVYTFYEEVEEGGYGDGLMLELWKVLWRHAGWEPRVLTLADAMSHPDYGRFHYLLTEQVSLGAKPDFDRMNYLRWLAMGAVGGGYLTDVDVYPLWRLSDDDDDRDDHRHRYHHRDNDDDDGIDDGKAERENFRQALHDSYPTMERPDPAHYLPFDGRFTVLCGGPRSEVPCFMSGSEAKWNQMSELLIADAQRHVFSTHWSDMKALQHLLQEGAGGQGEEYPREVQPKVFDGGLVLRWLRPDEFFWDEKCGHGKGRIAVHFSPYSIQQHLEPELWRNADLRYKLRERMALAWMGQWAERCLGEYDPYRVFIVSLLPSDKELLAVRDPTLRNRTFGAGNYTLGEM